MVLVEDKRVVKLGWLAAGTAAGLGHGHQSLSDVRTLG